MAKKTFLLFLNQTSVCFPFFSFHLLSFFFSSLFLSRPPLFHRLFSSLIAYCVPTFTGHNQLSIPHLIGVLHPLCSLFATLPGTPLRDQYSLSSPPYPRQPLTAACPSRNIFAHPSTTAPSLPSLAPPTGLLRLAPRILLNGKPVLSVSLFYPSIASQG